MKRVLCAIAAAGLLAAACGGAGGGAATAAPTPQTVYVFTADLSPANENPAITDAEGSGSGTATVTLTTGGTSITKDNLTVAPDLATDIIANPGNYYYNVHSKVHPGGVVRGQLKAKS